MPLKESLPKSIQHFFDYKDVDEIDIQLALSTDIAEDGSFGERWLVTTKDKVFVFSSDGDNDMRTQFEIPLKDISCVKVESMVGNGMLEATVKDNTVELLRYSNSLSRKFAKASKKLEKMAKGEDLTVEEEEDEKKHKCEKCGFILTEWSSVCPNCLQKGKVIRRLLNYVRPYWLYTVLAVLLLFSSTGIGLIPPYLRKILIDDALKPDRDFRLLGLLVLALGGIRLAEAVISVVRGRLTAWLGSKMTYDIRTQLYECLQRLSVSFYDRRQTGTVMSGMMKDTEALQEFLAFDVHFFVVNMLLLIGIGAMLIYMNWRLALLTLVPTPLVAICTMIIWKRIHRMFRRLWHYWSRLSATLNDSLSGIRIVKAFAQEDREINRFNNRSFDLFHAGLHAEQTWATFIPILSLLISSGTLIVWYFGGRNVITQDMTLGTLIAFITYLTMFYRPLEIVTRIWGWITKALAASERIFEILDTEPEVADEDDAVPVPDIKGGIEFQDVTFGYDSHKPVLHNINLKVKPGEMIGLVGRSGAGKSTTINLICRFYKANEGCLLVDGIDICKVRLKDLRSQVGIVPQESFVFSGTISENISYAKSDATPEQIMRAAKAANAHDFIVKFPDGYDTQVGERGTRLSGGERQRIAIARAILHAPKILILDEATSSVDTETERQIQEALARLISGRTTFAIAHRLSTLRNADRLCVLEEGKMVEIGTHNELLEKKGVYYKLVQMQTELAKMKAVEG